MRDTAKVTINHYGNKK